MGAWGPGNFENDTAVDWISDVEDGGAAVVQEALLRVADAGDYIESTEGCEALAAAELVAAALGRPPVAPENPEVAERVPELVEFAEGATDEAIDLAARMPELADFADLARRAVAAVVDPKRSELYQLWLEDGQPEDDDEWIAVVNNLRVRLYS